MTLDLVIAMEWAVTEKGLINYCRVKWIRGVALPVIVDVLTGYLSCIFLYRLATTQDSSYRQFSHK